MMASTEIPEHCPGTQSEEAGKATSCAGCPNQQICSSGIFSQSIYSIILNFSLCL